MSSCCAGNDCESAAGRCPQSGSAGAAVDVQTVKALLTEQALARLEPTSYRFCADARCDVVYFGGTGSYFGTADLRVPVWQKLPSGSRLVCYCFGESEASIRAEIELTGQSLAVERIREHIGAGRCACDVRNPRGTCCLGDVIAAVKRVEPRSAPPPSENVVRGWPMSPDTTFTIGELAARTGMTPDALRYYERLRVIAPVRRTAGGYRVYTAETIERLRFIKQAQLHGLTLAEIRELLQVDARGGVGRCRRVQRLLQRKLEELDTRLMQLQEIRQSLEGYLAQCDRTLAESPEAECPVVDDLRRTK